MRSEVVLSGARVWWALAVTKQAHSRKESQLNSQPQYSTDTTGALRCGELVASSLSWVAEREGIGSPDDGGLN